MNLRAFGIGLLWAGISAVSPAAVLVFDDYTQNEFTNWKKVQRTSIGMAGFGIIGFWRKHRAELKLPPDIAAAIAASDAERGR